MTLLELIDHAIEAHEEAARYAGLALTNRRRIKAALLLLDQGKLDEVRAMLNLALADDGKFMSKRVQRIIQNWYDEHAGNNAQ
jgi:hypothetical protein